MRKCSFKKETAHVVKSNSGDFMAGFSVKNFRTVLFENARHGDTTMRGIITSLLFSSWLKLSVKICSSAIKMKLT